MIISHKHINQIYQQNVLSEGSLIFMDSGKEVMHIRNNCINYTDVKLAAFTLAKIVLERKQATSPFIIANVLIVDDRNNYKIEINPQAPLPDQWDEFVNTFNK